MTALLQISDAHFGTERPQVVEALVHFARVEAPELAVMSGDITQRARGGQFDTARRFVADVNPAALLAIPGNHDIPLFNLLMRARAPYANYARAFGADLEPVFNHPHLLVIGVNTTRPRRHKDGELSSAQIERVSRVLSTASASQLRVIVVHQPVLAIRKSDEKNLLHGHREAIPAWAAAGGDIIMGGHIHLPYVRSLATTFSDLPRDMWTVQAGTAVSSRLRDGIPNSVNVIRCNGDDAPRRCSVERWDHAGPANRMKGRFELHSRHELRFE
jgi:3',5'-cyclic AMP phosphodiesterase CpdA